MSIHWKKRPTYEEIIKDLEKDYKVKLPDRVALNFYDSFAHTISANATQHLNKPAKRGQCARPRNEYGC